LLNQSLVIGTRVLVVSILKIDVTGFKTTLFHIRSRVFVRGEGSDWQTWIAACNSQ